MPFQRLFTGVIGKGGIWREKAAGRRIRTCSTFSFWGWSKNLKV